MTVKITIVGLGKIGASVGLALASHSDQLYRLGHDLQPENARRAQKTGAVDKVAYNLPSAARESDIVLLALPLDQIPDTLKAIALDLKEGAVVMDTAPVKSQVAAWAAEILPQDRYYIGLTPALNPEYLHEPSYGIDAAREDMFANSLIGIVAPPGTNSAAIKLATDLTNLLGAEPLFLDMIEVDSLMAAVHLAPQIFAAGLMATTTNQPGWLEGRKIAGAIFAQTGGAVEQGDQPAALARSLVANREHNLRVVDTMIAALKAYRDRIEESDEEGLIERFELANESRIEWLSQRRQASWQMEHLPDVEVPSSGDEMRRWLIGKRRE